MVVPVLNKPELLYRMLDTIDHPVDDLLIIDNGRVLHKDPIVPMASRVHVLRMPTNLGVPASWNLGIKALPFAPWWLIVNSDAWFPTGSLEGFAAHACQGALTLSAGEPPWCAFALGDKAVAAVGLFDEALYPAYFEDDDWTRRAVAEGVPIIRPGIPVHHDNSSTISEERYAQRNRITFAANAQYYGDKVAAGDFSQGHWSLTTRRKLTWD